MSRATRRPHERGLQSGGGVRPISAGPACRDGSETGSWGIPGAFRGWGEAMKRHPVRATTIREALADPQLLGRALKGDSWQPWRMLLIAAMGEALSESERLLFRELTGRDAEPLARIDELVAVVGRRGGKSRALAVLAVFLAILVDHSGVLAPGERGIVLCIAPDQRQAKLALDYAGAAIAQSPILRQLIAGRTADALELKNGISIEVRSASFRRLRGPTYIAVLADEAAFWHTDESA